MESDSPEATPTGQPVQEPISGIPSPAPVESEGHAEPVVEEPVEVTPPAKAPEPDTFFDRKEWEDNLATLDEDTAKHLRGLEKQLTGQWTKKNQNLSADLEKVQAYNAFMEQVDRDPQGAIRTLQEQLGLTQQQAAEVVEGEKEYNNWDDVFKDMRTDVMSQVRAELAPLFEQHHKLTTQQVEAQFDTIDPDWRVYEDQIKENIKKYPNMVTDIPTLYRNSVPSEILEQRATKEALKRLEKKTKAAAPSGPSPVRTQTPAPASAANGFDEAVIQAKKTLGMM